MMPHTRNRLRGFTIIELLVVFSVIAIISGVGFASFSSYSTSQRLTEDTKLLKSTINDAKNSAISQVYPTEDVNGNVINCVQSISGYRIDICSVNGICNASGVDYELVIACGLDEYVLKTGNFYAGVSFDGTVATSCNTITYRSLTGEVEFDPPSDGCQVAISNGSGTNILTIDRAGNISE